MFLTQNVSNLPKMRSQCAPNAFPKRPESISTAFLIRLQSVPFFPTVQMRQKANTPIPRYRPFLGNLLRDGSEKER